MEEQSLFMASDQTKPGKPQSVFEFEDFKDFIQARVESLSKLNAKNSLRSICKSASLSPALYYFIVQGKRPLTAATAKKLATGLKLSKSETDFFLILTEWNQSSDDQKKESLFKKILGFKKFRDSHPLAEAEFEYYTRWYYPVIREMVALPQFKEDYTWIAGRIRPALAPSDVERAIKKLLVLGLLVRTANGKLVQANPRIATSPLISGLLASNFHREMIRLAIESIRSFHSDEREVGAITLTLSPDRYQSLIRRIRQFQNEIFADYGETANQDDRVVQINLQVFPLTSV